ncbi:MAG TPA: hypothetical protein VE360_11490, partial [Pyrinomonadaceae bacterium]|nr:hypothetical protein [Pyrinomonadaceae bacterium]
MSGKKSELLFAARGRRNACLAAVLLASACAGVALGCGWDGFPGSVRFGDGATDGERSRLPPLPFRTGGAAREKEQAAARVDIDSDVPSKRSAAEVDNLWDETGAVSDAGDLMGAQKLLGKYRRRLGEYVARTPPAEWRDAWETPKEYRERRNSA